VGEGGGGGEEQRDEGEASHFGGCAWVEENV
jgi:hypothetical protein